MLSIINGKISDKVSLNNRSFAFGDGIFETCKVVDGKILYFDYHLQRLKKGVEILGLNLDLTALLSEINTTLKNQKSYPKIYILKIIISRGESLRGYGFAKNIVADRFILVSDFGEIADNISLEFCKLGYGSNPNLAGIKHQNRLEQILAKKSFNDCIMSYKNNIISTTYANIFIIKNSKIYTPNLDNCGILGTRRQVIIDNFKIIITNISQTTLLTADEVFISNSLIGIKSIKKIQDIVFTNKITIDIKNQLQL